MGKKGSEKTFENLCCPITLPKTRSLCGTCVQINNHWFRC